MFHIWSLDNEAAFADLFIYIFLKHHSPSYAHDMFGPFSFFHFFPFDFFSFVLFISPLHMQ